MWFFVLPSLYIALSVMFCLLVCVSKWILCGRVTPQSAPLWSLFVWRTELVNGLYVSLNILFIFALFSFSFSVLDFPSCIRFFFFFFFFFFFLTILFCSCEALANPLLIDRLRGTPFLPFWFRMLGARVGKQTWIDSCEMTEV
jgi:hypothetical protein